MPRTSELSEHNRGNDNSEIVFTQLVDCPVCGSTTEGQFHTGAFDEDGLTDLSELSEEQTCGNPECSHKWEEEYTAWSSFGEAG